MLRTQDRKLFEESLRSPQPTAQLSETIRRLLRGSKRSREEILEELEEFRSFLRAAKREQDEDIVLEVMDFLVGWSSPHMRISDETSPGRSPSANTQTYRPALKLHSVFPATSGGVWINRDQAALFRELFFPPITVHEPTTAILNLAGIIPSPAVLQEFVLPLGLRLRAGLQGPLRLIIQTHDQGVADVISYLAKEYKLPIYIQMLGEPLSEARPAGALTSTEQTTLNIVKSLGGAVTASQLARNAGIEATAAGNRLAQLEEKGYFLGVARSRRQGREFRDPRFAAEDVEPGF
jgi:DNA-binding MarR family transcriptional regulator